MPAKLSLAMCTYNGGRYLAEQLESVAAQTRPPDELVVYDDCSTDDTRAIVEAFAERASFPVRLLVNEQNLGSTRNFERAIAACAGDLIALADQDDVWLPQKLELLERELEGKPDVGLAFSDGQVVDEDLRPLGVSVWESIRFGQDEQRQFSEGRAFDVLLDHNVVTGAAMAFRAEFRKLVLPLPTDVVHDGWRVIHDGWIALLISATAGVAYVPERLFKYRQHAGQQLGLRGTLEANEPPPGTPQRLREAARRRNVFTSELNYLRAISERLAACTDFNPRPRLMADLHARQAHLETRAALPASRPQRFAPVLRELLARRYHLYSNGLSSAAKDLWLSNRSSS